MTLSNDESYEEVGRKYHGSNSRMVMINIPICTKFDSVNSS